MTLILLRFKIQVYNNLSFFPKQNLEDSVPASSSPSACCSPCLCSLCQINK
ncbi:unnamed protein product [Gulo gulo]|uniref:Uncharacterized protein n=1 Tax=Gulo gulo TaxID=48420 RepID=A0A9X9PUA4_GULGU|nr:unnamed protein product [Gulo gulo]